jgi:hypothetical protein
MRLILSCLSCCRLSLFCCALPNHPPPLPPMTPCVFAFLLDDRCCTIPKSKVPMSLLLLFLVELIKEGSSFYAYFVFCVCVCVFCALVGWEWIRVREVVTPEDCIGVLVGQWFENESCGCFFFFFLVIVVADATIPKRIYGCSKSTRRKIAHARTHTHTHIRATIDG